MSEQDLNVAADVGAARALDPRGDGQLARAGSDEHLLRVHLDQRVAELERELAQARGREATWRAERSRLLAALAEAEGEVAELPALRYEAEVTRDTAYWLAVVQASWSWRLTRPVRAASRLAGRVLRRRPVS
jgi:hypothetical protein